MAKPSTTAPTAGKASDDVNAPAMLQSTVKFVRGLLWNYKYFHYIAGSLLLFELLFGVFIIRHVPYTEIDWKAYMEQVTSFKAGERDYMNIRGGTGPLVYPAGFLYVFSALHSITNDGTDVALAQYLFLAVYLMTLAIVLAIYYRARIAPPWAMILLCASKRMHSIYMLRLFNDCIAMLLLYISVYLFLRQNWSVGSFFYSAAVSIKMNILLFAPALFFLMLQSSGLALTIKYLAICAMFQILVALPFLNTYPINYLQKAFEFSRVFTYKWTVNWKFIPEQLFISKGLAIILLGLHLGFLCLFLYKWFGSRRVELMKVFFGIQTRSLSTKWILIVLSTTNFLGVCFSRTLHYQFYSWYFHLLPCLLWSIRLPTAVRLALFVGIEFAFNMFPATPLSSGVLQGCHVSMLIGLYLSNGWTHSGAEKNASLDAITKEQILNHMNDDHHGAIVDFLRFYGEIPLEDTVNAEMTDISPSELIIYIPKRNQTIAIGFESPVTDAMRARKAIISMSKEAKMGLEEKTKRGRDKKADSGGKTSTKNKGNAQTANLRKRAPKTKK